MSIGHFYYVFHVPCNNKIWVCVVRKTISKSRYYQLNPLREKIGSI